MKNLILTFAICLVSIAAFAQTEETQITYVSLTLTEVSTANTSTVNGELVWDQSYNSKSAATLTDTLISVTDDTGKIIKYRVLSSSTGLNDTKARFLVINDRTGKLWTVELFTTDAGPNSIVLQISNLETVIHYTGTKF
jgi:hypothetical protein